MYVVRRDTLRPHLEDGQRVMDRPEPRPAAPVSARCAADDVGQPLLPGNGAAALDSLLPFGGKQAGDVARSEDDVYLGREQGPGAAVSLKRGSPRQARRRAKS